MKRILSALYTTILYLVAGLLISTMIIAGLLGWSEGDLSQGIMHYLCE
jgi:hypothetical protein